MRRIKNIFWTLSYGMLAFLPSCLKRQVYNRFLGADIHPSAYVGFSYIRVGKLILGENAHIGHLNYICNLDSFELKRKASVGKLNKFTAQNRLKQRNFRQESTRSPSFAMGAHSSVVSGHYFDCNNHIELGDFTIVAGAGTTFYTHGINIEKNLQESSPIIIGSYCMIAGKNIVIKGSKLPDRCVLAAGSLLNKPYNESFTLYAGVPARPVKTIPKDSIYFHRDIGFVP